MKLLVCIAYHHVISRIQYLKILIENFINNYTAKFDIKIIVDTNSSETRDLLVQFISSINRGILEIIIHDNLPDPFLLTGVCRRYIKNHIKEYDIIMYTEDDIFLSIDAFIRYLENFKLAWPRYVPGFIRLEVNNNGKIYSTDVRSVIPISDDNLIKLNDRNFILADVYHAFWILPSWALEEVLDQRFDSIEHGDVRAFSASYPFWCLGKSEIIEIRDQEIRETSCVWHLPNNYTNNPDTAFGKILLKDIISTKKSSHKTTENGM